MKIKVPAKEVEVCDICSRETGVLYTCLVCKKEYCMTCEAIMAGCIHQPSVCKVCAKLDSVIAAVERFVKPLLEVLKRRDKCLRLCGKKKSKV